MASHVGPPVAAAVRPEVFFIKSVLPVPSSGSGHAGRWRGTVNCWLVLELRDVDQTVQVERLARVGHLRGRRVESPVQEIPLPADGDVVRAFVQVQAGGEHFAVGRRILGKGLRDDAVHFLAGILHTPDLELVGKIYPGRILEIRLRLVALFELGLDLERCLEDLMFGRLKLSRIGETRSGKSQPQAQRGSHARSEKPL